MDRQDKPHRDLAAIDGSAGGPEAPGAFFAGLVDALAEEICREVGADPSGISPSGDGISEARPPR